MLKATFALNDAFETKGLWWLPTAPDKQHHGTLKYSKSGIRLEIPEGLEPITAQELMSGKTHKRYPVIHGVSGIGRKLTLIKACSDGSSGHDYFYTSTSLIVDAHTSDAPLVGEASVFAFHLDSFVARRLFGYEKKTTEAGLIEASLIYTEPAKVSYRIESIKGMVEFDIEANVSESKTKAGFEAKVFLRLKPDEPQDLNWFIKTAWSICYLLTLITDETVTPTAIVLNLADEKYQSWLMYPQGRNAPDEPDDAAMLLFYLAHLQESFGTTLEKWMSVTEVMRDSIHLMMNVLRKPDLSDRLRFQMAVQAIEVFSRATSPGTYMSEEEYKPVYDVLVAAIPKNVAPSHRSSLKKRIEFGYENALRKRIKDLIVATCPETRAVFCNDHDDFIVGLVDTRNYLSHYTEKLRKVALEGSDMIWATEKMLLFLRILFLSHLGLSEKQIIERMKNHYRLAQRIHNSKQALEKKSTRENQE